jgi:hypothetical protein
MNYTPRPGSSIDKAIQHLKSVGSPVTLGSMACALDCGEEEVGGMLRYGVQEGLLAYEERADETWWSLGDRKPGATTTPRTTWVQELSKARAEQLEHRTWPGGYSPQHGGTADRIMRYLDERAPAGSEAWVLSRDISQALNIDNVAAYLNPAEKRGAVKRSHDKDGYIRWQMGAGKAAAVPSAPQQQAVQPTPAAAPAPAPVPEPEPAPPVSAAEVDRDEVAERAAMQRLQSRPFVCGAFSNGRVTIQKGAGQVELDADESLELFEHLSGFIKRSAGARP